MLQYCSSEKKICKTFKNCSFRTLFRQNQSQHESYPKSSHNSSNQDGEAGFRKSKKHLL